MNGCVFQGVSYGERGVCSVIRRLALMGLDGSSFRRWFCRIYHSPCRHGDRWGRIHCSFSDLVDCVSDLPSQSHCFVNRVILGASSFLVSVDLCTSSIIHCIQSCQEYGGVRWCGIHLVGSNRRPIIECSLKDSVGERDEMFLEGKTLLLWSLYEFRPCVDHSSLGKGAHLTVAYPPYYET